jgi:hypothetical protein
LPSGSPAFLQLALLDPQVARGLRIVVSYLLARRTSISRPGIDIAVISVTGVVATFLTAFLFEALTDRDWSVSPGSGRRY